MNDWYVTGKLDYPFVSRVDRVTGEVTRYKCPKCGGNVRSNRVGWLPEICELCMQKSRNINTYTPIGRSKMV